MLCPFCSHEETKVLESRVINSAMRRRRECLKCENRFTTYEQAEFNLRVLKKSGKVEDFSLPKIQDSLEKACGKIDSILLATLSTKVQQKVLSKKTNPVKTTLIGKFVLQELKKVDKMAYLRYASIYKQIDDPKLLEKELSMIA